MMPIFDLVFPIAMIVFPAVFALVVRVRPADVDGAARSTTIARLRRRLFGWTAAALAVYGVLRWIGAASSAVDEAADFMWLAFFPLWFKGAMPLLQAKDIGWAPRPLAATMRAAALVRRDVVPSALRTLLVASWTVWGALALTTVATLLRSAGPQWWLLAFTLMGAMQLLLGGWFARSSALEPEPLDAAGSSDLQAAYADLRRLKQWGGCAGMVIGMLLFTVAPLLIAWDQERNLAVAIWLGAGGGSLLGLGGAVVGVMADLQRTRINRLYRQLTNGTAA
jgi:hypothetical protein